ncbi:hypothetical protein CASFOL_032470 [Castilleja foliolosa]|uniref:Uncharacterized protein n=1 Tax=Castilleja foliolosa TaxID=1961234 RepID=A0ABD3C247_9LAMI
MPGTIQVTVLEFKGVSSPSNPSAKSLKVSMGKRHYQTFDKGEFSFPITKLREDLVVTLLDAGGNEIAHADIRTMQIVEKVSWDDVFSINGGGDVHMKLQFVLSEEERNRIRIMRESAMKKKLETNTTSNLNLRLSETVSSTRDSVEVSGFVEIDLARPKRVNDSQAGSSLTSSASSDDSPSSFREGNATDGSSKNEVKVEASQVRETQLITSFKLSGSAVLDNSSSVGPTSRYDHAQKPHDQGSLKKTPSNVMKMISAFENSKVQEVKSIKKAPSVPSQLNRFRKDVLSDNPQSESIVRLTDKGLRKAPSVPSQLNRFRNKQLTEVQEPKVVMHAADKKSTKLNDHFAEQTSTTTEPSQAPTLIPSELNDLNIEDTSIVASREEQTVKELKNSSDGLKRQSTSATATTSGRTSEEQYQESLVAEGSGSGRGTGLGGSTMVDFQVDSNPKPKSVESYKEECYLAEKSGTCILPDNTRPLYITTAGNQVNEAEACSSEVEVQEKILMHEAEYKTGKNHQKKIADQTESRCGDSPNDSSNGLFGQVIKIAVILGFGLLVFFTRQNEPRKKHREEKHNFSTYKFTLTK